MNTTYERRYAGDALIGLAAWCAIVAALLQIVLGIPLAALEAQDPPLVSIVALNLVNHLLLVVGVVGLARSGATGEGRLGTAGLGVTLLGLVVLTLAEVNWLAGLTAVEALYGIGSLATALGLILAGAAVVRAGRWSGWRRFAPLACGLYIPLVLLPSFALPGFAMNYAIGVWGICWLLVGLALRTEAVSHNQVAIAPDA